VEALVDNGRPPISWQDIRGVFLATVLAVRSIREGIPFDIPGFH